MATTMTAAERASRGRLGQSARRPVWAEVDLEAIRANTRLMVARSSPARLCAVVKANAYGHGPAAAARAAVDGGAASLAVALVEEGAGLRDDGLSEPILLLSEPPNEAMADVVGLDLTPTLYTSDGVESAAKAVAAAHRATPLPVHLKVDTGMHRVGASPADALELAVAIGERPELDLAGLWTHFAVADNPAHPFTAEQAGRFAAVVRALDRMGIRPPVRHMCNSSAVLGMAALERPCHEMVRCGISLYGVAPSPALEGIVPLRPALSLRARVSYVKDVAAGEGVSYGLRYRCDGPTRVATVPIGYADGVPWRLSLSGGDVLIGGRRRPIAGSVTMDQILVDCGPAGGGPVEGGDDSAAVPGDEVVLLGSQGGETIGAWEWAERVGTIAYDVLCGISPRVPRIYVA